MIVLPFCDYAGRLSIRQPPRGIVARVVPKCVNGSSRRERHRARRDVPAPALRIRRERRAGRETGRVVARIRLCPRGVRIHRSLQRARRGLSQGPPGGALRLPRRSPVPIVEIGETDEGYYAISERVVGVTSTIWTGGRCESCCPPSSRPSMPCARWTSPPPGATETGGRTGRPRIPPGNRRSWTCSMTDPPTASRLAGPTGDLLHRIGPSRPPSPRSRP